MDAGVESGNQDRYSTGSRKRSPLPSVTQGQEKAPPDAIRNLPNAPHRLLLVDRQKLPVSA